MDAQIDLEQYGNLPRHVRQRLATADKPQDAPQPSPSSEEEQPSSEPQSQPNVIEQTPAQDAPPANQPPATDNAHSDDDNEVKAWKGRLNKLQAEHKATSEKLLAEAEARQAAESEAKELREKYAELEQKSQQPPAETEQTQTSQPPQAQSIFSDEELTEIEMTMGATGEKFAKFLRSMKNQPQQPVVDVGKVVDERLAQERQRSEEQARQSAFGKAVQEHTPKLQGLLNDSAFIEFANSEVIDFAGNTAAQLLNFVGANQRADLLPKVAELIAKFEQSRQPPAQQITAPPSNKEAAVDVRSQGKKPKPSAATIEKMKRLMRTGQVDELRELQEKYDLD